MLAKSTIGKDKRLPIRRPVRIYIVTRSGSDLPRAAAISGDDVNLDGLAGRLGLKRNALAIRRSAWIEGSHRRNRELEPLAAVHSPPPQGGVWKRNIGCPLTIPGKAHPVS